MTNDELKEHIFDCYSQLFDLQLAYKKYNVGAAIKDELDADTEFQARLLHVLIKEREHVFNVLKNLMSSGDSDTVRLKAALELGKIIYPVKFIEGYDAEKESKDLGTVTHKIDVQNDGITAEVLEILSKNGVFASGIKDVINPETD